ncbi:MAG: TonB-dependent receptor [Thermoanaerobaculia bacterium]
MKRTFIALVALALLLAAFPLAAQETTSAISGTVTDASGAALPGVTVEAVNTRGQRYSAVTDGSGTYRMPAVPPGNYTVTATLSGLEPASLKNLSVTLGGAPRADLTLRMGAVTETLTVTAEAPIVDVTRSAVATSVTREDIEELPRGRDFTDVVAFTPGARNDTLAGGISIDGASGLENRYIIDGIDTTDPQIGDSAVPMRAEFMEEVQVKTAGYAAEFGGSTGGVINAITRSGSNQFFGGLLVDYENNSLNEDRPELNRTLSGDGAELYELRQDDRTRWDPGFFLGGPILRDRLWFFGSYQPGITETERTVTFQSLACVANNNCITDTYKQDSTVQYATGNITTILGSKLSIKAGFSMSPYETEGGLPSRHGRTTTTAQSAYATGVEGDRETYSATADFTATNSLLFSGRAGYYMANTKDVGIPFFPLIHNFSTAGRDPATAFPSIPTNLVRPLGFLSDPLYTAAQARDKYERTSFAFDGTYFLNAGGQHAIKAGFQREQIANDVASGYNADRILYYWDRTYTNTSGDPVRGQYGYFRLLNISTFGQAETNNDAIFIQDAWTVLPNLTLNIGLRAEHERIPNYGVVGPEYGIEFDYADKIAPRLGFAWDPLDNGQWKVYGSYGTYYDVMKYELPRGSFGGDKWVDYWFTFDNPDWTLNNAATCRTGSNTILERPVCPAGSLIEVYDQRHNAADPESSTVDPDLKPMEMWEAQLGGDRQLATNMRLGARYVHKELVRAIEDVGVIVPGVGQVYYIANPGYGVTTTLAARPFQKAKREYDALEFTFERRLTNRWGVNASYTYSRLWGNYTGLASADEQNGFGAANATRLAPNVSRAFDVVEGNYDASGNPVYGKLPTDRPHQFKAQFVYQFPWQMTAAVNQFVGSGTPVSEQAILPGHNFFLPKGYGSLGRTPTLSQTDLALNQEFSFGSRSFTLTLNVLNLLDQDTVTHYYTIRNLDELPVSEEEFFAGFDYEALVATIEGDAAYRMPDVFQGGREVRLGLRFNF